MNHKIALGASTSIIALTAGCSDAIAGEGFEGLYLGLGLSANSGVTANGSTSPDYSFSGQTIGHAFIGANMVFDSGFVVGAEAAMSMGAIVDADAYETSRLIDVKLKAGQTFGSSMVYGFAGATLGDVSDAGADGDMNYASSGGIFGIGYERIVSDRFSIGAEIGRRVMNVSDDYQTGSHTFAAVRGIFRF